MKRILLVIALAALFPLGLAAVSAPAVAATAASAATAPARLAPDTPQGPSGWNCGLLPDIKSSGSNNGIPVYHVTANGCLDGIHACRALGNDGTTQGVECADIYAEVGNGGTIVVMPVAEGMCQNLHSSDMVQCANVSIPYDVNSPGVSFGTTSDVCGHSAGSCDNASEGQGRNEWLGDEAVTPTSCGNPGTASEFWTVDLSGGAIELPSSDKTVTSTSNMASQHAIICS